MITITTTPLQLSSAIKAESDAHYALGVANGKRRTRTGSYADVEGVVRDLLAAPEKLGLRLTLGTVANSYTFSAPATVITAAIFGDTLRLRIHCGYATKVAGGGHDVVKSWGKANQDVRALLAEVPPAGTIEVPLALLGVEVAS